MLLGTLAVSVCSDPVKHDSPVAALEDIEKTLGSKPSGYHELVKEVSSLVEKAAPKVNKRNPPLMRGGEDPKLDEKIYSIENLGYL